MPVAKVGVEEVEEEEVVEEEEGEAARGQEVAIPDVQQILYAFKNVIELIQLWEQASGDFLGFFLEDLEYVLLVLLAKAVVAINFRS